jgi:hypothetical protein
MQEFQARLAAFYQALALLGWIIGRNVRFDIRWAPSQCCRNSPHATELAALAPDVSWPLAPRPWERSAGDPQAADRVSGRP